MLPGVELARRRRLHQRAAASAGASIDTVSGPIRPDLSSAMGEAALLARSRLRERLRGPEGTAASVVTYSFSRATERVDRSAPSRACTSDDGDRRSSRHPKNSNNKKNHHSCSSSSKINQGDAGDPSLAGASPGRGTRMDSAAAEEVCAVCLDTLRSQSQRKFLVNLPCSHNYHFDCVRPWLASNSRCPCCRKAVVSL